MDKYESNAKGAPLIYTSEGIYFGSKKILFADMTDIAFEDGETPGWSFVYKGRHMLVPYEAAEKEYVEPFIRNAMKAPGGDLTDLPQETPAEPASEPVVEPVSEPVAEPVVEPTAEPVSEPAVAELEIPKNYEPTVHEDVDIQPQTVVAQRAKKNTRKHYGNKNKKPFYKRVPFYLILAALLVVILVIVGSGNQFKLGNGAGVMSESDYKASCSEVDYNDLCKNPDKYEGEKLKFTGQVRQVVLDNEKGESEYIVGVTKDESGAYDDNIYLYYTVGTDSRIIEEDIVTIYGVASGEKAFKNILGEKIKIPAVTAVFVEF